MNKIEEYKKEKAGLDILDDIPRYAAEGWESITDGDKERLKWAGIFFRRQTPGRFMMRLRFANGFINAAQLRTIGEISRDFGKGFADITTRQQMQLREFAINDVPEIWRRLRAVDLISLQTGMDNIRGVIGCPVAGLTPNELFDASPVARQFTDLFIGNSAYTDLPRKFNVTITACKEACTHAEAQDLALTPALKEVGGAPVKGFNVAAGGKLGSGGFRMASPLDLFVTADEAAAVCSHIVMIFRDHGARELRTKARLAFLIEEWGVAKFRMELERRVDRPLASAGTDQRAPKHTDHVGVFRQQQAGLNFVGLAVPVGRMTSEQMQQVADVAENYGSGQLRLSVGQNVIIARCPRREDRRAHRRACAPGATLRSLRSHARSGELHRHGLLPFRFDRYQRMGAEERACFRKKIRQDPTAAHALVGLPGELRQSQHRRHRFTRQKYQAQRRSGRSRRCFRRRRRGL